MEKEKNYNKILEDSLKNLDQSTEKLSQLNQFNFNDFHTLSRALEEETAKCVFSAAESKTLPTSDNGKRIVEKFSLIRSIGNKFANMLKIEFKITFCGVVLCHLEIPKLNDNSN